MHHAQFTHLHVHTEYSLLDGAIRLKDLFKKARELKFPALAMTDHGAMHGTVEFYKGAEAAGIKPIIGCEAYVAPGSRRQRSIGPEGVSNFHLILLCKNDVGYRNLCKLVSIGYTEGFYYKPRLDKEVLREHAEGLIGLSACLKGEVPWTLRGSGYDKAKAKAEEYASIFGEGNYYLEMMENGIPEQAEVNKGLMELSKDLSIPLVATNDCHYLEREDAKSHEVLVCVQTGRTIDDPKRMKMETDAFYLRSHEEMSELFHYCSEAVANTVEIAQRCNVELDLKTYHFPDYELDREESLSDCLDRLSREGLEERFTSMSFDDPAAEGEVKKQYRDRLEIELKVIRDMQFPGYFLIVQDFINWAKANGVPVGPGRGSAAGSLVAYALRITNIDPIPYDLLFERFLNPERVSLPDIDVDFCFENRDKVIDYVTQHYGDDKVGQISTFGKMLARAVIRDVGRALDIPYGDVDKIAKLVPSRLGIKLAEAIEEEPKLRELMGEDQRVADLMTHALKLEGLNRHASTHAAGVVIANRPLTDYLPIYKGKEGETVTQFAMNSVENIGLIKFDFLGLKTLTVIEDAVKLVNKDRSGDEKLDIDRIPLDDKLSFELLCRGETTGVFQLESSGMKELMIKLRPSVFEDVVALVALYRPGPLGSGMVEDFIRRKHGEIPIVYDLPQLEPILKDTYGIILYQEQVMKIAQVLANYSLGEADLLRRAMGKKKKEEMDRQRERFLEGARDNKINPKIAEKIFDLMAQFAEYGFNKSHSAAYGLIAYQTAYLKAHFPVAFMAALLTNDHGNTDKVVKNINECREMNIEVLQPDVNQSDLDFAVVGGDIRFGLKAVKNVGEAALLSIVTAREEGGAFKGLLDFCKRVDLKKANRKVIESLIHCGGFDTLGGNRAQYMNYLDHALERAASAHRDKAMGQESFFNLLSSGGGGGAEAIDDSTDQLPDLEEVPVSEKLHDEKLVLGLYLTGHPLREWSELLEAYTDCSIADLGERADKSIVTVGGTVAGMKKIFTKTGKKMAFVTLEDMEGMVEVVVFNDLYERNDAVLGSDTPIAVRGTLENGDEQSKILADEILPLEEAPERLTETVHIRINGAMHTEEDLKALHKLLGDSDHRGDCGCFLHILLPGKAETVMRLPSNMALRPSRQLKEDVHKLFGAEVVTYR